MKTQIAPVPDRLQLADPGLPLWQDSSVPFSDFSVHQGLFPLLHHHFPMNPQTDHH
jgi:hypothetical protein